MNTIQLSDIDLKAPGYYETGDIKVLVMNADHYYRLMDALTWLNRTSKDIGIQQHQQTLNYAFERLIAETAPTYVDKNLATMSYFNELSAAIMAGREAIHESLEILSQYKGELSDGSGDN